MSTITTIDERAFGGVWFEIAHWGSEETFLRTMPMPIWTMIHEKKGYYRTSFRSSPESQVESHKGYALLASVGAQNVLSFNIATVATVVTGASVATIAGGATGSSSQRFSVVALQPLAILYTDYLNYAFIGNSAVLYILCRRPVIEKTEVQIILTIAVERGYSGPQIEIRRAISNRLFVAPGTVKRLSSPSFFIGQPIKDVPAGKVRLSSLDEVCPLPCRPTDDERVLLGEIEVPEGSHCDLPVGRTKPIHADSIQTLTSLPLLVKKNQ